MHSIKRAVDASTTYTATDISDAAVNISKCLAGKYETLGGKTLHVNGDIRKLRTATKLSPALSKLSKRMLQSMEGTAKKDRRHTSNKVIDAIRVVRIPCEQRSANIHHMVP